MLLALWQTIYDYSCMSCLGRYWIYCKVIYYVLLLFRFVWFSSHLDNLDKVETSWWWWRSVCVFCVCVCVWEWFLSLYTHIIEVNYKVYTSVHHAVTSHRVTWRHIVVSGKNGSGHSNHSNSNCLHVGSCDLLWITCVWYSLQPLGDKI